MYRKLFLVRLACLLSLFCITDSVYTVDSQTLVSLSPVEVQSPDVGEQLVLSVNIAGGENVAAYGFALEFDSTALRFMSWKDTGYLPGAHLDQEQMDRNGNQVGFAAISFDGVGRGAGTLAVIIFDVIAVKASVLRLSEVRLFDHDWNPLPVRVSVVETAVDPPIQEPVQPPVVETSVQEPFQPVQAEVSIPDANLAAAIREALGLPAGAAITSDALLNLTRLDARGRGIADLTGMEYAVNLTALDLGIDNEFHQNPISNLSPLASLTNLERLNLGYTGVSDVSALASLTQLKWLDLSFTGVSDVSALASLTQLEGLDIRRCPLNAAAHQTHIPAIQLNRTQVEFDPFEPIQLPRVPWLVSLIYFRPSDRPVRPNVDAEIDGLIKKAQRFYADEMERHGFGRKTFQFETDAHGNAVVHHVNGKFPNAHYQQNSYSWVDEIREQIDIPAGSITVRMLDSAPGTLFTGAAGTGGGGNYGGSVDIDGWDWRTLAHELAHAFGLTHDGRPNAKAKRIQKFTIDLMLTSFCTAEWLSVHPAFNPGQPVSTSKATIEMLPPTLASPPNTIRLRFEVTDLDGLHQAQLQIPDFVASSGQYSHMVDYEQLDDERHSTVEFVTTALTPQIETVMLSVIDVRGHMSGQSFPIDVASLLPPAKVVSIPDPNLAAAVRERLNMSSGETFTTHSILNLVELEARNRGIKSLTGLEHAVKLKWLYLNVTGVSDVSALAHLTNLETLYLNVTGVSDVSALANLTNLEHLDLRNTAVSDVLPLLGLNLPGTYWDSIGLLLGGCPLSYASIHTHIPALQAKGIGVEFDDVAHPALLKVSGDGQEDAGATALPNPFVVEAMDEHGKPIVGRTVQFDILGGEGTLSAKTVETDAQGKARVTFTLGRAEGVNKVRASAEGIQSWVLFMAVATEAAPQLVADVNGDGVTNLADLAIVAQAMGKPVENPRADVNGDGVVDGEDFALVAAHLGEGEAAAPSQAALPAGLTLEKVEWALNLLYAENTGSPAFRRGIAKLEGILALLVPDETLLLANYPNPFNPETWIPYQLSKPAEVTVTIYAANGAVVRRLDLGHRRAGSYDSRNRAAYWDGRNAQGEPVASGVYFYTLSAGDFKATRKMVIRK